MADFRVFDIETSPDISLYDATKLDFKLSAHVQVASKDLSPRVDATASFPPQHAQRVVSISWVDLKNDEANDNWFHFSDSAVRTNWTHETGVGFETPDEIEGRILAEFSHAQNKDRATLVSWNGRTFDLPVIALRSMKQGIQTQWYWAEKDVKYRYSENGHIDVMDYLSDYGAARSMSLDYACRLIGLPGKAGEVHGSNIAEQYAKGDSPAVMEEVSKYCLRDSLQTAILFVRSRYQKGLLTPAEYNKSILSFQNSEDAAICLPDVDWDRLKIKVR